MRVMALIGTGAIVVGLAAAGPANADGASAPQRRAQSVKARVVAKPVERPLSYRRDSSPYFSYGYPRLYYYPWGLTPRRRWL